MIKKKFQIVFIVALLSLFCSCDDAGSTSEPAIEMYGYTNRIYVRFNVSDYYNSEAEMDYRISSTNAYIGEASDNHNYRYVYYNSYDTELHFSIYVDGYHSTSISQSVDTDDYNTTVRVSLFSTDLPQTTVSGTVQFRYSSTPISDVNVYYADGYSTTTDNAGNFSLTIYHRGNYNLQFSKETFWTRFIDTATTSSTYVEEVYMEPQEDYWTRVSGKITDTNADPIEGAYISAGDIFDYSNFVGGYSVYVEKGVSTPLNITYSGDTVQITIINSYDNYLNHDYTVTWGGNGNGNGSTTGPYTTTVSGNVTDIDTGNTITDSSLSVSLNTTIASLTSGSYSESITSQDGLVIIQASATGYNLFSTSFVTTNSNYNADITLTPLASSPISTTFSGYITDELGNVPTGLDNYSLSINAQIASLNSSTGYYTVQVPNHMGAVILQGAGNGFHAIRRTISTIDSSKSFDFSIESN